VIEKFQSINARALSNAINFFNPGKILLGGAFALNHPKKLFNHEDIRSVNQKSDIEICSFKDEAVLYGLEASIGQQAHK